MFVLLEAAHDDVFEFLGDACFAERWEFTSWGYSHEHLVEEDAYAVEV